MYTVASRKSGDRRTSGTVMRWVSITGSCTSPRDRISATAWRMSSPARKARWDGPFMFQKLYSLALVLDLTAVPIKLARLLRILQFADAMVQAVELIEHAPLRVL